MRIVTSRDMGTLIRGRRKELDLSQTELAASAGVARSWVAAVEAGKPTAEIGRILRLLEALDLCLEAVPAGVLSGSRLTGLDKVLEEFDETLGTEIVEQQDEEDPPRARRRRRG